MNKKALLVLVAMMAIGQSAFASFDFSAVASSGQTLYYTITSTNPGTVTVTHPGSSWNQYYLGYTKPTGNLTIPSSVNCGGTTYSVTSLGDGAFHGCNGLTSVTIPSSVTSIGNEAFTFCSGLTTVTIPNSISTIGDSTFYSCSSLTSVIIPNSVTSIGNYAFSGCSGLTSITIPNSVTSIDNNAFSMVRHIEYYGSATGSPWGAISMNGVTEGDFVYSDATKHKLTAYVGTGGAVTIPSTVDTIGNYAFYKCGGLTSVTIPNSVTSIGVGAFYGCSGLTSVTIPNSVTSIGVGAFYGCSGLTSVTIPNNVTSIDNYAFFYCTALTSITIPNSVTSIGEYAFYNCSGLISVIIPNSVTSIGVQAFSGCSGLTSVTIPNNVTLIESAVFSGCSGLISVTIPNSVTTIGDYAFSGCSSLISVTIPNRVISIGNGAFKSCSGLTSVTVPNSVTSIGEYTFRYCNRMTDITFGSSVISIGGNALDGCTQIVNIHMRGNNPPTVQANTFEDVPSTANLHVPCNAVTAYENAAYWSRFNIAEEFPYSFSATSADLTKGMVQTIHVPECGNWQAEVQATPYNGFHFVRWSDGNTDAYRYLVVVQDTAIQAEFAEGSEGIEDVDALNAKVYINDGQIVVEGAEGNSVTIYDVSGRVLATKCDDFKPMQFDVPASGTYLIKIGYYPARRVVVIR